MPKTVLKLRAAWMSAAWGAARQAASHWPTGGDWALGLPESVRRNLRWFWWDGLYAAASDNIPLTYLTLYVLALGATQAQIGFMSALSSLSAALLLLPGALLVERLGRRHRLTLIGGGLARLSLLLLAVLPWLAGGQAALWVPLAILLSVCRDALGNLVYPAWVALTADLVPLEGRGRYFAARNAVMGFAGMITTLLVGEMITRAGQPLGYQMALGMAFVLGMASTYSFGRLHDPQEKPAAPRAAALSLGTLRQDLRAQPLFLKLCATAALWNFFLNIPGPFFGVYQVENLHATATMVGINSIASSVATLLIQRKAGEWNDRWGARRVQMVSGLLIPVLPLLWTFVRAPWHIIPINLLGGVLWGAYSLASFNFLLAATPAEQRARYSALYQIVVTVALAAGAALGGLVISRWGYAVLFLASALGRWLAAGLFARFVRAEG